MVELLQKYEAVRLSSANSKNNDFNVAVVNLIVLLTVIVCLLSIYLENSETSILKGKKMKMPKNFFLANDSFH